jgi:hypothetical protein
LDISLKIYKKVLKNFIWEGSIAKGAGMNLKLTKIKKIKTNRGKELCD